MGQETKRTQKHNESQRVTTGHLQLHKQHRLNITGGRSVSPRPDPAHTQKSTSPHLRLRSDGKRRVRKNTRKHRATRRGAQRAAAVAVRRRPVVLEDRTERTRGRTTQPHFAFPSTRGAFGGDGGVWMVGVLGGWGGWRTRKKSGASSFAGVT